MSAPAPVTADAIAARITADVLHAAVADGHAEYARLARELESEAWFLAGVCAHPKIIVDHEYGSFCVWCGEDYRR